jgi:hypothetical protein
MVPVILAGMGKAFAATGATMLSACVTKKVVMRIVLVLMDKVVRDSKNKVDDAIWAQVKEALEQEVR